MGWGKTWASKMNFVLIIPHTQDLSLDLLTFSPVCYYRAKAARLQYKKTESAAHNALKTPCDGMLTCILTSSFVFPYKKSPITWNEIVSWGWSSICKHRNDTGTVTSTIIN